MMSYSKNNPHSPSGLSHHLKNYSLSHVYGAKSNHLNGFKHDILPSKYGMPGKSGTTGTSFNSSNFYEQSHLSYNSKKHHQPSPPKDSYTFTSSSSGSSDIVRPAMRDKTRRTVLPSNHSSRSPFSTQQRYRNASLERTSSRARNLSPMRERVPVQTLKVNNKSQNSDDLKASSPSTSYSTTYSKSPGISSRNSPVLNGGYSRKHEEISIDNPPYRNDRYEAAYLKRENQKRIESPKRSNSPKTKVSVIPDGNGTTGLKNIGNTCFMNSMIQCLSHSVQLRDYCLRQEYMLQINTASSMRGKLIKAFADVIKDLWSGTQTTVTPSSFKSQIQKFSPRFTGYEQQDSQEFLRFLLEGLHEDINQVLKKSSEPLKDLSHLRPQEIARETWNWYGKKDRSFIFDLFVGQLESYLQCSYCNHVSLTYDPFWDLSLPISKIGGSSSETTTLDDCLRAFTKQETLDRDEKPLCERCKTRRKMTKKLSIHRFPKILVIHLKRFHEGSRYRQKLSNNVKFPVTEPLKLAQFSSETCEDRNLSSYDLYAVSNHLGSCYGGHYTAYCVNPVARSWYEFDDSRVSNISQTFVCTKEAYVLFYVQRNENGRSSRL